MIANGQSVVVKSGFMAMGHTLEVLSGGLLSTESGAQLVIATP
jgi:hypothetical protein